MKQIKFLVVAFVLLCLCISGCEQSNILLDATIMENGGDEIVIDSYVDRILTEDDFSFLEKGMSLEEIEVVVGEKSGTVGSGLISPYYKIDVGILVLIFNSRDSENLAHFIIEYYDGSEKKVDLDDAP